MFNFEADFDIDPQTCNGHGHRPLKIYTLTHSTYWVPVSDACNCFPGLILNYSIQGCFLWL